MSMLVGGRRQEIPGLTGVGPGEHPSARLSVGDYAVRHSTWVRQGVIHTTKGIWPQKILSGSGPGGRDLQVADYFSRDSGHAGAHIVLDDDGTYACLADLLEAAVYHATTANDYSIGIEVVQRADGAIYEAQIRALGVMCRALSDGLLFPELYIPWQRHEGYVSGQIVRRLLHGGPDVCGWYGHRDQAWKFPHQLDSASRAKYPDGYANRGRGDPGDFLLAGLGCEAMDYRRGEDLDRGRERQRKLNRQFAAMGVHLKEDGVMGPATLRTMRAFGLPDGRSIDALR